MFWCVCGRLLGGFGIPWVSILRPLCDWGPKRHGPPPYVAPRVVLRNRVRARVGPCQFRGSAAKMTRTKTGTDHISQDNFVQPGPLQSAPTRCNIWWWSASFSSPPVRQWCEVGNRPFKRPCKRFSKGRVTGPFKGPDLQKTLQKTPFR